MRTVTMRNLDDEVIERAKSAPRSHDRSLEAELRMILTRELKPLSADGVLPAGRRDPRADPRSPQTDSAHPAARRPRLA